MQDKPSQYVSMRQAAMMCGLSPSAFKASFKANFFPFQLFRISAYRTAFRRSDVEEFVNAQESRIVDLHGEQIVSVRVEP